MNSQHNSRSRSIIGAGAVFLVISGAGAAHAEGADPAPQPHLRSAAHTAQPPARNAADRERPVPDAAVLAPLDTFRLHAPQPVPAVAPIAPPSGAIRVGDLVMPAPDFLPREQAAALNTQAAAAEAQVAAFGDSIGLDPARSDRMAAATVAGAAVGANVGSVLASPITSTSLMIGAAAGLLAGVPFLPIGLVVGPVVGGAIGAAVITVPAMVVGGTVGAALGAASALAAPAK